MMAIYIILSYSKNGKNITEGPGDSLTFSADEKSVFGKILWPRHY